MDLGVVVSADELKLLGMRVESDLCLGSSSIGPGTAACSMPLYVSTRCFRLLSATFESLREMPWRQ